MKSISGTSKRRSRRRTVSSESGPDVTGGESHEQIIALPELDALLAAGRCRRRIGLSDEVVATIKAYFAKGAQTRAIAEALSKQLRQTITESQVAYYVKR